MDTTLCPECGALAEVQWRAVMEGTDGPVEHAKVSCVRRHWFLLPIASLERPVPVVPVRRVPSRAASVRGEERRPSRPA
jgi:hypothetical protein